MIKNKVLKTIFIVSMIVAIGFPLISINYIYPSFTNLLIKNVEKDAINAGNYISGVLMKHRESFDNKTLSDDFYVEISKIVESFELMKLKIFLPSGEVIYSTDSKDIGKINDKPYFRAIVAKGEPYSKIVNKGGKSKEGELLSIDVIEIYVPNMIAGQFDGAYEFYYDITALSKEINQVVLWSSIIPLVVMFIFLVVIVAIMVRADKSKLESPMPEKSLRYQSPYYSMAMAAISIFIAEIIAMYVVHSFKQLSEIQMMLTDAIILIMLIAPSAYFFFVQPLMKYISELRGTHEELRHEIAEHTQAKENLQQYHNKLELILDSSGEGIYGLDLEGNTTFINPAAARMIGWNAEELIGKNQHDILHHTKPDGTTYPREECPIYATMKDGITHEISEEVFWRKNGSSFPVEYISTPIRDMNNKITGIVVTFMDITDRKNAEEELHQMAYYDQLTSLPNRANFLSYLGRMLKRTKWKSDYMFAVLFIDLDNFKIVNDSLGHLTGDKLLIEVARRLEECTRLTDRVSRAAGNDRVSRFGGDEFALFLNDVKDISSASRVADRIQKTLQKPFNIDGHELFTSASIGIALSATGYENEDDILRDADSAMYRAKATGKAHAEIFDNDMHIKVKKILQLESDLRTAVEEEQFMVYYQPVVSATDSRITGAEALIRWNHPEQGFISPMDFIPIAEETGLITTIGEWVLRTACAQNKAWQDAGYPNLLMKVNFSSRQFKDENLTEVVKRVIRDTNMPAQLLDVEITESIAMADNSIKILNQLTAMGLRTSIDDFGTGYSSLGSLTKFPINTIKIDRAFIKEITININAEAIIKAIIAMAHSLNMEVLAEGVETEDQLAYLQSQKCDKIQGYLFSRPVPGEDFAKLLEKEKNDNPLIQKPSESIA